ncbi:MAG: heavy-metal-associated domain-containing protein [Leptospira sp.]|nr:heavy-metal-associated domain-containing protein [Leptospira sp.]NCS95655.1 heavy-metal-associated domain-containing protein [Leptospira sp.]
MSIEYKIEGMTCGHCVMTVEEEFSIKGIKAKASQESNTVKVDSEISKETYKELKDNLQEQGYELGSKIS